MALWITCQFNAHGTACSRRCHNYQTDHLDATLLELALQLGESTKLGGADRGEVCRVGEQNGPTVVEPLVEVEVALFNFEPSVSRKTC